MTSFNHSAGRENAPLVSVQCSGDVLSEVSNPTSDTHITMADNTNGKGLKVISSTDSTSKNFHQEVILSQINCLGRTTKRYLAW